MTQPTLAKEDSHHPVVVFIYDATRAHSPCHAVRKNTDGPWSKERVAFCGWQASVGPTGFLTKPEGGLCHRCAEYCSPHGEGDKVVWRAKTEHADPLAERLARKLFEQAGWRVVHGTNQWLGLPLARQLEWIAIARVAIDNHPVAAPVEPPGSYLDDD